MAKDDKKKNVDLDKMYADMDDRWESGLESAAKREADEKEKKEKNKDK